MRARSQFVGLLWLYLGINATLVSGELSLPESGDDGNASSKVRINVPKPGDRKSTASDSSKPSPNQPTDKTAPLQLTVDLVDGSRIVGMPATETLQLHTSFAD